jgi:hypothetical protein
VIGHRIAFVVAGVVSIPALLSCELLLDTGNLSERRAPLDATVASDGNIPGADVSSDATPDVMSDSPVGDAASCGLPGLPCCSVDSAIGLDANAAECAGGSTCCNGSCVDTTASSDNCGACNLGCFGGACTSSVCQPAPIVTYMATTESGTPPPLDRVLVDDVNVYWSDPVDGLIYGCSKLGCASPSAIVSGESTLKSGVLTQDVAVQSSGRLYWQTTGNLVRTCPKTSCASPTTVALPNQAVAFFADQANLYWSDASGNITQTTLGSGATTPLGTEANPARFVGAAWGGIYTVFTSPDAGPVIDYAAIGVAASLATDDTGWAGTGRFFVNDGTDLEWDVAGGDAAAPAFYLFQTNAIRPDAGLGHAHITNPAPSHVGYLGGFVVDVSENEYSIWTDANGTAYLTKFNSGSATETTLARVQNVGPAGVSGLAFDSLFYYFGVMDTSGKATIYRLAR